MSPMATELTIASADDLAQIMGGVAGHGPQKRTRSRITFNSFQELERLDLGNCQGVEGDVGKVMVLKNLRHLDLSKTRCTGELSSLALCSRLHTISLADTAVQGSIAGLDALGSMVHLNLDRCVNVSGNLADLAGFRGLVRISLRDTVTAGDLQVRVPGGGGGGGGGRGEERRGEDEGRWRGFGRAHGV